MGCKDNPFDVDISNIKLKPTKIDRFEASFYNASKPEEITALREKYPFFFNSSMTTTDLMDKVENEDELRLFLSVSKKFKTLTTYEKEITELFRHVKYYYPRFVPPRVFSYVSNLDYPYQVVYADSLIFIALDFFLGNPSPFYRNFPSYISATFAPRYLTRQVAYSMVEKLIPEVRLNTLLDGMIYEGKKILLLQAFMPEAPLPVLMQYSDQQWDWCERNEKQIWSYFVSKEIFYQPYYQEAHRFLKEAPFSKFYLDIDRASPGRVGTWLGYKILKSYIDENPKVSLIQVIEQIDSGWLFRKSAYKPS